MGVHVRVCGVCVCVLGAGNAGKVGNGPPARAGAWGPERQDAPVSSSSLMRQVLSRKTHQVGRSSGQAE